MSVDFVRDDVSQAPSVGRALESGQALTTAHPLYRMMTDEIVRKTEELSARRGVSRATARYAPLTVALEPHESQLLATYFPEFNLVNYGSSRPGHAWWVQFGRLANEWMMVQARNYGGAVAHLGGSVLSYLLSEYDDACLLADPTSASAAHERHTATLDAYRLFQNYAKVAKDLSLSDVRGKYEAYLRKERFVTRMPVAGMPQADVLCVDCSAYAYAPLQVASMMMQAGASLAFGCFVYNPIMLMQQEGEIPGTGVFFRNTPTGMTLQYPEGQAGTLRYSKGVWESWLASQVFPVGKGVTAKWFQLELLQDRSHLMFFRMTALAKPPVDMAVHHALELPSAADKYLVNSWELSSLGADPSRPENWINKPFLVSRRLVDRVFAFAMQLEKTSFTRYAIRKQIHVTNDRVTIEGTSVTVNSPLGVRLVDSLVVAIYSRAFVERFESGQLTAQMMQTVQQLAHFNSTTWAVRVWMIARVSLLTTWDYTFGYVDGVVRNFSDWVRRIMRGTVDHLPAQFVAAPPYALLADSAVTWLSVLTPGEMITNAWSHIYQASVSHSGFAASWTDAFLRLSDVSKVIPLELQRFRVESISLHTQSADTDNPSVQAFVSKVRALNPISEELDDAYALEVAAAVRQVKNGVRTTFSPDADPVFTLNELYAKVCPGVALQDLEHDVASVSLDPQDRNLAAPYLKLPTYFGEAPRPKELYPSRLKALNVPKRQGTLQELVSSMAARNLNAPQVSLPQDEDQMIQDIWNVFLDQACVEDARDKLKVFQHSPVDLTEQGLTEWAAQATPEKLQMARKELEEESQALGEMPVGEYLAMLKADVKPTLSTKPLDVRTEPQVIVYHKKALSALYSAMFRMLVRRFLSLMKPNYHVNLLKDTADMEQFVRSVHPFGSQVQYLENDFSKYDKSQGRFAFKLEEFVFRQLGLDEHMLRQWVNGHVECSIRSVALGLSLHVMYQRKSGDATTAFGNVLLNVLSVTYAYKGTQVLWALFMGDDSLVCAKSVGCADSAVAVMAEVFNLGAKTYCTEHPYFASNFVLIDSWNQDVAFVADPVKRVERWSMMISADDPQWHERFVSAADTMKTYLSGVSSVALARSISARYQIPFESVGDLVSPIATLVSDERAFRKIWEEHSQVSLY